MGASLSIRDLRHRRGGRLVLSVDALELGSGERLAVLGPNGAGKTTLLRLIAALENPSSGTIAIDGVPTAAADAGFRRRVGYATQRAGLLSTTVTKNVELPLRWRGISRPERRATALASLERLGVAHLAERPAFALSGGEAQRVSLARALAVNPTVLLLDEPAAGLDAPSRESFLDDLEGALVERATTVVHVSHRSEEALRIADRVAVLVDGAVQQLGEPGDIVRQPATATVARLVGYHNVIPAEVDRDGLVLIAGNPCGLREARSPGPVTLAAWGAAVRLVAPRSDGLEATVERVSPRGGCWEVFLAAGPPLRAHIPLDLASPRPGDRVGVRLNPAFVSLINRNIAG